MTDHSKDLREVANRIYMGVTDGGDVAAVEEAAEEIERLERSRQACIDEGHRDLDALRAEKQALIAGRDAELAAVRERLHVYRGLLTKVAEPLFDHNAHGEDLGMWLDCGDITEDEYKTIKEVLNEHP